MATKTGTPTATTQTRERTNALRTWIEITIASDTHNATAAAVCPDGKLEVGGEGSKRGTLGRGRFTRNVVVRNTRTSTASAIAIAPTSRHSRRIARRVSETTPTPITVPDDPIFVAADVRWFKETVRRVTNQTLTRSSQRPNAPCSKS